MRKSNLRKLSIATALLALAARFVLRWDVAWQLPFGLALLMLIAQDLPDGPS